jgi:hypothetical protein
MLSHTQLNLTYLETLLQARLSIVMISHTQLNINYLKTKNVRGLVVKAEDSDQNYCTVSQSWLDVDFY